jgi:hypothetical protein
MQRRSDHGLEFLLAFSGRIYLDKGAGAPISTAFTESAVNQIVATRMIKRQQTRWNRETVQPFLTVRVVVLNET